MEHAPAFDTLRFARTLVDAGVERRHAEAHAKAASAAVGAAAMKTASAEGLRAVGDRLDGVENQQCRECERAMRDAGIAAMLTS